MTARRLLATSNRLEFADSLAHSCQTNAAHTDRASFMGISCVNQLDVRLERWKPNETREVSRIWPLNLAITVSSWLTVCWSRVRVQKQLIGNPLVQLIDTKRERESTAGQTYRPTSGRLRAKVLLLAQSSIIN